jgi:hypothetical protein
LEAGLTNSAGEKKSVTAESEFLADFLAKSAEFGGNRTDYKIRIRPIPAIFAKFVNLGWKRG